MTQPPENVVPITPKARSAAEKFGAEHDRELLTILFTDLVDSTKLQQEAGNVEAARLTELHREIVRDDLAKYDAREIEWAGDSCLAVFTKPSDAVVFALRMQAEHRRIRKTESELPLVRVGMHLGEIVVKKRSDGGKKTEDLFGLQVSEAARVMSVARGNQVFCTRAVFDNARSALKGRPIEGVGEAIWVNYGAYLLKGSEDPIELCEIGSAEVALMKAPEPTDKVAPMLPGGVDAMRALIPYEVPEPVFLGVPKWLVALLILIIGGFSLYLGRFIPSVSTPSDAPITSLAVLPLENLMNDPNQDYFVDGMTEAITAELSKISSLKVISRTSAMHYRDTNLPMPEIAAELGVTGLIEGSVLREDDDVRITVQLIDGPDDRHLWTESYTNTVTSVLKLQAEVALAIADEIRATLSRDERERIADVQDIDPDAYDLFLRGWANYSNFTKEGFLESIDYFERAVEIEPRFAKAWAALGRTHFEIFANGLDLPGPHLGPAKEAARTALRLDASIANAHATLGGLATVERWDWDEDRRRHDRALLLNPNSGSLRWQNGFYHQAHGAWSRAREEGVKALDLDPRNEYTRASAGLLFAISGDSTAGIATLESVLEEWPESLIARNFLIYIYWSAGRFEEALDMAQRDAEQRGRDAFSRIHLSYALAANGEGEAAQQIIDDLKSSGELESESTDLVALAYLFLGDIDTAFEYLEQSFESPSPQTMLVTRAYPFVESALDDPHFIAFRTDPRFFDLLNRMKLSPVPPGHPGYKEQQAYLTVKAAETALAAQPKPVRRFEIDIGPTKQDDTYNVDAEIAVSRDGTRIAYVVQISDIERRLFIRDLTADTVVEIQSDALVTAPFFSPDGEWVGYSVSDGSGLNPNHLMKVPVRGGAPAVLCESLSGLGATWLDDDTIVFAAQDEDLNLSISPHLTHLFRIDASGGIPERLTKADGIGGREWSHNRPFALPDNRAVVFAIRTNPTNTDIALLRLDTGNHKTIATNAQTPQYAPSGHITFVRENALWAIPFDLDSLEVAGEEVLVQQNVQSGRIGSQAHAITSTGDLVYAPVLPPDVDRRGLVWVDLDGNETNIKVPLRAYTQARISSDGTKLALTIGGDEFLADASIWLHDLNRPNAITQLTNERSGQPVWLPDGRRIVYGAFGDEAMNLYVRRTDGLGDPEPLLTAQDDQVPLALTPSGDAMLIHFRNRNARNGRSFRRLMIGTNIENVLKRPVSERRPFEFLDGEGASNWNPVLSPNEKWVAYLSYSSNTERHTFVRPYPFVDAGRWQVSTDRGGNSRWAQDGSALYFWNEGKMMIVDVATEGKFTWETPRVLFEGEFYEPTTGYHHFDIHPDGDRFLMIKPFPELNSRKLMYIENWVEEVERLAPHPGAN